MHLTNGHKYNAGANVAYFTQVQVLVNDIITIVVDMDNLILSFELDNIPLGPAYRLVLT